MVGVGDVCLGGVPGDGEGIELDEIGLDIGGFFEVVGEALVEIGVDGLREGRDRESGTP